MSPVSTAVVAWFAEHARDLPWRREGFGSWGILVSEIMLQQTQVNRVIPLLEAWLERWPTPEALAVAPTADVVRAWANLGYPRRAVWLQRAATVITAQHGGKVPADVEALLRLPGIGDYTARAVAVFAFGMHEPVVDTNTRRVIARAVHGRSQPGPASKRDLDNMRALLPEDPADAAATNAGMMELGALVCTSRSPDCAVCPLAAVCAWRAADYPDTGDDRPKQARYAGSDRAARGAVLRALRDASGPVPEPLILADWPDPAQRTRAIASLLHDGLLTPDGEALSLP